MLFAKWFSPDKLKLQTQSLIEQSPVILMGRGHSGTRVLSWACSRLGLLLGTSEGLATGDPNDQKFTQLIKKIALSDVGIQDISEINEKHLQWFQEAVYDYYTRLQTNGRQWGWKFPETYLIGPYIARTFPKARYIHLIRDGRDIAFKRHLTDDPKRKLGKKILGFQNALDLPHHIQAAISWTYQVENFEAFCQSLSIEQIHQMRFEDLCTSPTETMTRLCTFLNMGLTESCTSYLEKNINKNKVAQYKENDPLLVQEVEASIGTSLNRHGYY